MEAAFERKDFTTFEALQETYCTLEHGIFGGFPDDFLGITPAWAAVDRLRNNLVTGVILDTPGILELAGPESLDINRRDVDSAFGTLRDLMSPTPSYEPTRSPIPSKIATTF